MKRVLVIAAAVAIAVGLLDIASRDDGRPAAATAEKRAVTKLKPKRSPHDPRGEVLCHDVVQFGGTWLAVRKSGEPAP